MTEVMLSRFVQVEGLLGLFLGTLMQEEGVKDEALRCRDDKCDENALPGSDNLFCFFVRHDE